MGPTVCRSIAAVQSEAVQSEDSHAWCLLAAQTLVFLALLICAASIASGQTNVVIRIIPESPGRVVVEGTCAPTTIWSFRDSYAGVLNLGSRVDGLKLLDAA